MNAEAIRTADIKLRDDAFCGCPVCSAAASTFLSVSTRRRRKNAAPMKTGSSDVTPLRI